MVWCLLKSRNNFTLINRQRRDVDYSKANAFEVERIMFGSSRQKAKHLSLLTRVENLTGQDNSVMCFHSI
jgi:hypothetical protein